MNTTARNSTRAHEGILLPIGGHKSYGLRCWPAQFKQRVDTLVRDIRGSERLPGVARIWLPGEQSHERRLRYQREGIPVVDALLAEVQVLDGELGIAPLVPATDS